MEKFFNAIQNMFKIPELRKRILFTLGLLAVYRLGAHVTAPGINKVQLERVWQDVSGTLLGVLDLFSGGNFRTISVFALGVTPYITASIILQLMTVLSPQVKKIQEEGEVGRQKINNSQLTQRENRPKRYGRSSMEFAKPTCLKRQCSSTDQF